MKKYIQHLFFVFIFLFITSTSVSAATLKSGDLVVLPKDKVETGDYFAAGETVAVAGTVAGDAYVAGGKVDIEGTIQGDLLVAGGTVTIRGIVEDDVRAAGGEIIISGTVNGNVTVAGGSVTINDSAQIAGNIVSGAGNLNIYAPVAKDVVAGAGQLTIANTVAGDVTAGVGEFTLTPNAQVAGSLTYYSEEPITLSSGAKVSGKITHHEIEKGTAEKNKETAKGAARGAVSAARILNIISAFIIGFLALRFFPHGVSLIESRIEKNPWASMGTGLLALIATPVIGLILLVTVVGIPFAMMLFFFYFFAMFVSKIYISLFLGRKLLGYFKIKYPTVAILAIGLITYLVITSIPVIGGIIVFIALITGIGAMILGKKDYYRLLVTKKAV